MQSPLTKVVRVFAPVFAEAGKADVDVLTSMAASLMHRFVAEKFLAWLPQLKYLELESAQTIGMCDDVQASLIEACRSHSSVIPVCFANVLQCFCFQN